MRVPVFTYGDRLRARVQVRVRIYTRVQVGAGCACVREARMGYSSLKSASIVETFPEPAPGLDLATWLPIPTMPHVTSTEGRCVIIIA